MPRQRRAQEPSREYFHDFGAAPAPRRDWAGGVRSVALNLLALGVIVGLSVRLAAPR